MVLNSGQFCSHARGDLGMPVDDIVFLCRVVFEVVQLRAGRIRPDLAVHDVAVDLPGKTVSGGTAQAMIANFPATEAPMASSADIHPVATPV